MTSLDIFLSGIDALQEYLSAHVLTCLIPAFFIAGAIAIFVSKQAILKYFGAKTKKYISYTIASVSGAILAVCSCTVLPLFMGVYKRGAGIGPATTFLFAGPAINILAIVLTARVLGFGIGLARVIGAVGMSILVGLCMAFIFRKEEQVKKQSDMVLVSTVENTTRPVYISLLFFLLLVLILVVGAASPDYMTWGLKLMIVSVLIIGVGVLLYLYYPKSEVRQWLFETWDLAKKIVPILLVGVFIVGIIGGIAAFFIPGSDPATAVGVLVAPYLGGNNLAACFFASIIGAVLYMPTLLEVAIVGTLFGYSSGLMGGGPALALLLAGPSLSLPNMIVITRVVGLKKAMVYICLVVIVGTFIGFIYGLIGG